MLQKTTQGRICPCQRDEMASYFPWLSFWAPEIVVEKNRKGNEFGAHLPALRLFPVGTSKLHRYLNSPFRQRFLTKSFAPTSLMSVRKPALLHHLGYTHLGAMGGDVYSSALSSLSFLSFFQVLRVAPIELPWPWDASLLPSVILCSSSGGTEVIQRLSVVAGYLMSAFQL